MPDARLVRLPDNPSLVSKLVMRGQIARIDGNEPEARSSFNRALTVIHFKIIEGAVPQHNLEELQKLMRVLRMAIENGTPIAFYVASEKRA